MKKRPLFIALAVGMILLLTSACRQKSWQDSTDTSAESLNPFTDSSRLRKLTFLPYWVANAQFAGYYVAKEKGIYQKYGLDVNILPFDPYHTSIKLIQNGEADFAAIWLVNAIEARASGINIVNIAQFSTRSSLMLVTKKSSGINILEDMNNKRAGIWHGYELQPKSLFKKYGLNVEIVSIGSTNNLFLNDGVEITNASWFDEYHSIINAGYDPDELNTFFFADYGLNFLEDGIYCNSELRMKEPGLCADFVKATAEGWVRAFNNPDNALDLVIEYARRSNLPVNRIHQKWMLDRYRDLYYSEGHTTTFLDEKDYLFAAGILKENGLVDEIPVFKEFYIPYDSKFSN